MSGAEPLPVIDGYQVDEQIGVGGFSRVFRGVQLRVDREVAIKVLNAPFVDDGQRSEFERECKVMGRLTHPHVVRVYDSDRTRDGKGCIVMELYRGTYRDVGRLSISEVVDVGVKIADALAEAHQKGIIHRDVKPHNLFISERGEPALGDFGISTTAEHTGRHRYTLKYAPPELLRDATSDAKGDIYSLGATIFQLASGRPPFIAESDEVLIEQIMVADPPRLERSDAPMELERLLRRCLSKQPGDRPRSAGELAEEFRRIQSVVGLPPRRPTESAPFGFGSGSPGSNSGFGSSGSGSGFGGNSSPGGGFGGGPGGGTFAGAGAGLSSADHTTHNTHLGRADRVPRADRAPGSSSGSSSSAGSGGSAGFGQPQESRKGWGVPVGVVAALAVVAAGAVIALSGDDAVETTPTTVAVQNTGPAFQVISAPTEFTVTDTGMGFRFEWVSASPDLKVQLHRVGTEDNVIADESPFEWELQPQEGGSCFEARAVNADETRLSQDIAGPECAAG